MDTAGQPAGTPETQADLTFWLNMVRRAVLAMFDDGLFNYVTAFKSNLLFLSILLFQLYNFREVWVFGCSLVVLYTVIPLVMSHRVTTRRLAESDLVKRYLARDPALVDRDHPFRKMDILDQGSQDSVTNGLKYFCEYYHDYFHRRRPWPRWINIVINLAVIGILMLAGSLVHSLVGPHWMVTKHQVSYGTFILIFVLLIQSSTVSALVDVQQNRLVCAAICRKLGIDLVGRSSELARGLAAISEKLEGYAQGLRIPLGIVLAGLGLIMMVGIVVAISAQVPGSFAALICYSVVLLALTWEFLDENTGFQEALERSGIAIKLFNGEFIPTMFSPAARVKAALLLPQAREEELARLAALLALEYGEYINYKPSKLRRYLGFVTGGIVLAVAAVYLLNFGIASEANEALAFALVLSALLLYLGLSSLISVINRLAQLLRYLKDEIGRHG